MDPSAVANTLVLREGQSLSTATDDITQAFSQLKYDCLALIDIYKWSASVHSNGWCGFGEIH